MQTFTGYELHHSAGFDPAGIVRACIESGHQTLLLDRDAIPPEFFDLSTGSAGELLHRLGIYGIAMAAVVPDVTAHSRSFQEFAMEANRGRQYRFFATREEAIRWLEREASSEPGRAS